MQIDDIDRRILASLIENARASYAEIGARVGLSAPAVKRRVDRLRADGAITGYRAQVSPAALGWTTEAFVEIFCAGGTSAAQIRASVSRHPEAVACYTVSGEPDALVHLRARDITHLERTLERLRADRMIVQTKTSIVLSRLIDSL
ncbi:Lrp/AsnC family transcriptional regulator [Actinocorallia sp. API 0066]|uniref:Lrp/AsnC family transcriptional regulator n=1 Tax=Actinocorallia sp. API 0066 TaxID=2896846 RepID=UPI001E5BA86A|nr:Lrp/AsnC family transcriptional regulator [Actinocorallia sp. API 0066]MCD0447947.1 Lrp/AsnC family transcriptional regulator [Actinocorallia sp. API 0066]